MIPLSQYAKIKNNYCICYFGPADEYLIQLKLLRPHLERLFPGLSIYIGCRDNSFSLLDNCERIIKFSDIKDQKQAFAHIRELQFDGYHHPVESLMQEAVLKNYVVTDIVSDSTTTCAIIVEGSYPTKNLTDKQISCLRKKSYHLGYEIDPSNNYRTAGLVMGVESVAVFDSASRGKHTILIPTGLGTNLYQKMFPRGTILNVD